MRQLVILSGKGGTGKTTLASAFIRLSKTRACADCDVDAPNLHLVNGLYTSHKSAPYFGLPLAEINPAECISCGECHKSCRFDAIIPGNPYRINPYACEGCGVCTLVCPVFAIKMKPHKAGSMTLFRTADAVISTAKLAMGSGTSGLLVSQVKKRMKEAAKGDVPFAVIDGSPGIGCPVISACAGTDLGLLVTEPSLMGLHDLKRVLGTLRHFHVPAVICINKADIYPEGTKAIREFAAMEGIEVIGEIPYDEDIPRSMIEGKPFTLLFPDSSAGRAIQHVWEKTIRLLQLEEE